MKSIYFSASFLVISICLSFHLPGQTTAKNGMVTSSSLIASEVGRDILKKGGNAIDASVATAFALAVTWPSAGNIGGGGFLVFLNENGEATTIDFREKAPLNATTDMYLDSNGEIKDNSNHEGILSVGVPGTVAGLFYAHQKYGRLDWTEVVQPAIDLAKNGFAFTETLHKHSEHFRDVFTESNPSMASYMLDSTGRLIKPGKTWKQPALAATLERIRDNGHDGFYSGKTAALLTEFMAENGGLITMKDLREYHAIERQAVQGSYRGFEIFSMGPPSSGGVILVEMLNMLENYELDEFDFGSTAYVHTLSEVMRRAYADRAKYLGDPDFNPEMPLDLLLSKEHARSLVSTVDPIKASISDSSAFGQIYEGDHTTHLSVVDKDGNAVSLTYTIEQSYGSKIVVDSLGFILNNEMGDFNPVPGVTNNSWLIGTAPNLVKPGKRMLSSMTPTIITRDGKLFMVIGSPGGRTIINSVLQTILNVVDFDMDIKAAIEAGKIHHQWLPDRILFEETYLDEDTQNKLIEMGHTLYPVKNIGSLMGIVYDSENKIMIGGADSSSADGGVAGY